MTVGTCVGKPRDDAFHARLTPAQGQAAPTDAIRPSPAAEACADRKTGSPAGNPVFAARLLLRNVDVVYPGLVVVVVNVRHDGLNDRSHREGDGGITSRRAVSIVHL